MVVQGHEEGPPAWGACTAPGAPLGTGWETRAHPGCSESSPLAPQAGPVEGLAKMASLLSHLPGPSLLPLSPIGP